MLNSPLIPRYVSHKEENSIVLNITLHISSQHFNFKGIISLPTLELLDVQGMPVGTSTPADGEGGSAEKEDGKRKNHAGH